MKEVIAACLGYESVEVLAAQSSDAFLPYELEYAEAVVLNLKMGAERAIEVCQVPGPCFEACIEGIERACRAFAQGEGMTPTPIYRGLEDFYYRHVQAVIKRCLIEEAGDKVAAAASTMPERVEHMSSTKGGTANELVLTTRCTIQGEDAFPLPVKCTTTFAKAGRAGLIFESFESNLRSMGQHAVLEVFPCDITIKTSDGSEGRAKFALIFDLQCGIFLGHAVGLGDEVRLAERAMHSAFLTLARWRTAVEQLTSQACQLNLDTDQSLIRAHLREIGRHLNVNVRSSRPHQHFGRAERLLASLLKDWRSSCAQAENPVPLDDLAQLLEVTISNYHSRLDLRPPLTPTELWQHYFQQ
ncbi:hypothetical protein [Pseudomonas sp. JV551A1]|uniref:hypothetical protein n=1 Tax=Pseudomonas sp. JV551A1 TaxID=2078787 RepID=UPI0010635842|nr:hypothetical protein [Pseudomonas sp. JV551A1]